jgi:hypothetical protein
MHATDSTGHTYIFMPRDREKAVNQLASLSALAAAREWERAALVALLVESRRGRPKVGPKFDRYSISDFARVGIYGLRSTNTIAAYLKIWGMTGLPVPEPGDKVTLPLQEFPDMGEIYGREPKVEDEDVDQEFEEDEDEEESSPRPRPAARPSPNNTDAPKPRPDGRDPIDALLSAFNRVSPEEVANGATQEQIRILYKSLESWLEDLKELIEKD